MNAPILVSRHKMFNGSHERYCHTSESRRSETAFAVYLPPQALQGYRVPVLYWLSGTDGGGTHFGAQRFAAEWGIALVMPDAADAGFRADAAQAAHELSALVEAYFPVTDRRSIAGCGAGGYGALHTALTNPGRYAAVSAFAPATGPAPAPQSCETPADDGLWAQSGNILRSAAAGAKLPILIDCGTEGPACAQNVQAAEFAAAARAAGFSVQYNLRQGYGHDDFFTASFIDVHIEFHADALGL